jgi:hypothetical protein
MKIEMDHYTCKVLSTLIIWAAAVLLVFLAPDISGGVIAAAAIITLLTW